jgi:hypothetical protein
MHFPLSGLPNAKSGFLSKAGERIIGRESATDALVHHDEAVVRERLIVHRAPPYEEAAAGTYSDGFPNSNGDHQKVMQMVTPNH